jgi:aerobic carbon-monoxide dehydrogenase small subunit
MWLIAARAWSSISSDTHRVKSLDKNCCQGDFFAKGIPHFVGTPPKKKFNFHRRSRIMTVKVSLTVNGKPASAEVEERTLLVNFIRDTLRLTGTHVGCDTAQCGACTIHMNGRAVKSCNMLAMQAEGADLLTIEGIAKADGTLHPMQEAFRQHHGLQCGFCTPGMVMSAIDLVKNFPDPSEQLIREQLDGNLCRCTGYHNIVKAIKAASQTMRS